MALVPQTDDDSDCPIRHLESQGLLLNVLNQLSGLVDLAVCSAVSRGWRELAKDAQPVALEISEDKCGELDAFAAASVMQWLQTKQRSGRLQNVRDFRMDDDGLFTAEYSEQMRQQAAFFDAALMASGFWNLHTCYLHGPIHLETAAALLPPTLRKLDIILHETPDISYLSMFERFTQLQSLLLNHTEGEMNPDLPDVALVLDGSIPSLKSCHIAPNFYCTMLPGPEGGDIWDPSYCFPNIVLLRLLVKGNAAGSRMANSFFQMEGLLHLEVCMLKGGAPWVNIVVPKSSSVLQLRLVGPPETHTTLEIEKEKDFIFEAHRVENVMMPRPARPIPDLHFA